MDHVMAIISFTLALVVVAASVRLEMLSTSRNQPAPGSRFKRGIGSNPLTLNSLAKAATLGDASSFRHVNGMPMTNAKGGKRVRLVQTYAGYDVFGSSVEAELDNDGYFSGQMYGHVVKNLHRDIPDPDACKRDEDEILNLIIRNENLNPEQSTLPDGKTVRLVYLDPDSQRGKIAYKVQLFYSKDGDVHLPIYFMDACSSSILLHYDGLQTIADKKLQLSKYLRQENSINDRNPRSVSSVEGSCNVSAAGSGGNRKTGMRMYNAPPFCLDVRVINDTICEMIGEYSKVVDNLQSYNMDNQDPIQFNCLSGYFDSVNGAFGVAFDTFYYAEMFGRLLQEKYGTRMTPGIERYVVHFGNTYENAFYNYDSFFFGDGRHVFYPLTVPDIIAHETAHALVFYNSGLVYRGQPGGINEAFADITGETFKHFMAGSNDWKTGWGATKRRPTLRYLDDPSADGKSINYYFRYESGMGVHFSSGVYNYAFYNLVEKQKMDIFDAYKCFLDANRLLWTPFTGFVEGACKVMQACYDNGLSHSKVRRAFFRAGIPLFTCNYRALTTSLFVGESRESILVSKSKSPVVKVELGHANRKPFVVEASAKDLGNIRVVVGSDPDVHHLIAKGDNHVRLGDVYSHVYVKLFSDSSEDVHVTLNTFS